MNRGMMTLMLVALAGVGVAAEKPAGARAAAGVASLPAPDAAQPLLFDLFIGELSAPDLAKHQALLQKEYKTGFQHLPGKPFLFGFTLVEGRLIKPYTRVLGKYQIGGPTTYPEAVPDVGHCAYGAWGAFGSPQESRDEFHAFTVERQGDVLCGSCSLTATQTAEMKTELKMTWTAKIVGGTQVEGQAEVRWGEMVVTRPLTGIVRQGLAELIDPLNCIYQFADPRSGAWAVVVVADGKPTLSRGYLRGQQEIRLRRVEVGDLHIARHDRGVNGFKADLDGSVTIEGGKAWSLTGIKIGVNGVGWGGTGVDARAYSPAHPVTRRWDAMTTALYQQAPVPAELKERADRQAVELPAMPEPSPAAKYHFKYRASSFIYAPWLDFATVAGAVRYRFEVVSGPDLPDKHKSLNFIAPIPQASLAPIWKDYPVDWPHCQVRCTALDATGAPLGEAQTRRVMRKAPYGASGAIGAPLPLEVAQEAVLRGARIRAQHELGLAPLYEHLAAQGRKPDTWGIGQCQPDFWSPLAAHGDAGYERDLARAVASHYARWLDVVQDKWPMGIPWSYGGRFYYVPKDHMPKRLDSYELTRDPKTGALSVYEASLRQSAPEMMKAIQQRLARLQQPSGGWSAAWVKHMPFPIFYSGASMFGSPWLDFNTGSFLHMAGRLRCGYGCTGEALSMELKAQHWLDRNALRTGWWEVQEQQGSPADWGGTTTYHLLPYILYLLEYALPEIADLDLAESLARLAEEHFMNWRVEPRMEGTRFDVEPMMGLARIFLLLHQRTGDPLHLAKADALIAQRLRNVEPVWGRPWLVVSKSREDVMQHPVEALKTLTLRREIGSNRPVAREVPADGHLVLTLDRLVERTYRVVVHLAMKQRTVDHAVALTPTRQPIDVDFTQPGRLHLHPDTVLHHTVEASGLKVGPRGLDGDLVLHLSGEAKPLRINVALASDYGILRGTWRSAEDTGRAAAEIRAGAAIEPRRTHIEVSQAAVSGEAWQNWAAALWRHAPDGSVAGAWFGNNNAGWSAAVTESSLTLTEARIEGSLRVAVTWDGVADAPQEEYDDNKSGAPFDPDGHRTREWREGKKAWLANWRLGTPGKKGCFYYGGFKPFPPYVADNNDVLIYRTTWKEVAAGDYVYRFQGRRLGDVLAGTVTVKCLDGKEHTCQFLGGVE